MPTSLSAPLPSPTPAISGDRPGPSHLRIGVIGAGKMAQHHARAIGRTERGRLVAVCDPAPDALAAMRAIVPDAETFTDAGVMFAQGSLEVVHICTPPETHSPLARMAIAAGCHVYIEKPVAPTRVEIGELVQAAEARGVMVCPGHQLLFEEPARRAAELMPAIGKLIHIESYFSFRPVRRTPGARAPLRADLQLLDILPHPVYLLLEFLEKSGAGDTELLSLHVGSAGTVNAMVKRGASTGVLTVTLEGRPVESYLRLVGTSGSIFADFVRGTVQRHLGPGTSGIDKLVAPYRQAGQLLTGTTRSMARRVLKRERSYPGLRELFDAFYTAILTRTQPPISTASLLDTTRIWEEVAAALEELQLHRAGELNASRPSADRRRVVLTGGTGFVGREVARTLVEEGWSVLVIGRRVPAIWDQLPGVEYRAVDLSRPLPADVFRAGDTLIHAAAETAGSWDAHQRNSIDATEHVLRAASGAGVKHAVHVSSVAVLGKDSRGLISEASPLLADSRGSGPYVWGKLESERLAATLANELGIDLRIARPGAVVDYRSFDPPGRLGKRIGNVFVAVGSPRERLGIVDVQVVARALAWMVSHPQDAPRVLNLVEPELPPKRQLVNRLRDANPDLSVVWLPWVLLYPMSWAALGLQKVVWPRRKAMNVARIFSVQRFSADAMRRVDASFGDSVGR